jgi:hypothetical protein
VSSTGTRGGRGTRSIPRSESRLVRRASVWAPGTDPISMPLAELEEAAGVRWVDIRHRQLRSARAIGTLNRVCDGLLTQRMARDLATPHRFPATGAYGPTQIRMTAAFLVRHLQAAGDEGGAGPVASVLKPIQILIGEDWLLSAWLPSRLFRGHPAALAVDCEEGDADRLHRAVAASWRTSSGETAHDLAALIRRELAVASGHRSRAV